MTILKIQLASFVMLIAIMANAQTDDKTLVDDFQNISGRWKGSLTYLDYSSGKPYTMPADVVVKRIGKSSNFTFSNIYPNEPSANSIDTLIISTDWRYIDKEVVKSRTELSNGEVEIITEETGTDGNDNKPAKFRHTYTLGKTRYKKRKDVQLAGETLWINRHEYTYTKMPG